MRLDDEVSGMVADWRQERPDIPMDSLLVLLPLRRALQAAESRRARMFERFDLTPATLDLLVAVCRVGPPYTCTPSDLARQLVLSAGGVSQRLERLEQAGLIERAVDQSDRRMVQVAPTTAGLTTLDEMIEPYVAQEELMLADVPERDRAHLRRLLLQLHASIDAVPLR